MRWTAPTPVPFVENVVDVRADTSKRPVVVELAPVQIAPPICNKAGKDVMGGWRHMSLSASDKALYVAFAEIVWVQAYCVYVHISSVEFVCGDRIRRHATSITVKLKGQQPRTNPKWAR